MDKIDIKSLSKKELEDVLRGMGQPSYRAAQIFRWLYKLGAGSFVPQQKPGTDPGPIEVFDGMTDLPEDFREKLKRRFHITRLTMLDLKRSALDGTAKYLFKLEDGNTIETVFLPACRETTRGQAGLPEKARNTICLSSQVGCKYACSFCASAPFGFVRSLSSAEILDEVLAVKHKNPSRRITNLVFMGIGEPFDNYDNVLKAIRIFNDKDAFDIGARRITISTCGIIPGMEKLSGEGMQIELAVSLHSADDKVRSKLVPINKKYPLKDLIGACRKYTEKTNRVITFEYILMEGVNISKTDAHALAKLLKGLKCKVNTISYNQVKALGYNPPSAGEVRSFMKILKDNGVNAVNRKSRGEDIDAGCGQLRISKL